MRLVLGKVHVQLKGEEIVPCSLPDFERFEVDYSTTFQGKQVGFIVQLGFKFLVPCFAQQDFQNTLCCLGEANLLTKFLELFDLGVEPCLQRFVITT